MYILFVLHSSKAGCVGASGARGAGGRSTKPDPNNTKPEQDPNPKKPKSSLSADAKARLAALEVERKCIRTMNKWDTGTQP